MMRPGRYVIGSPGVFVPAKVCVALTKRLRLDEVRETDRGNDPDVDETLLNISFVEQQWRALEERNMSAVGRQPAPTSEPQQAWNYMTTTQVAGQLRLTPHRVTDLIRANVLPAQKINGQWFIARPDFETYRATRAA